MTAVVARRCLGGAIALLIATTPRVAAPCDCAVPGLAFVAPADGASEVPLNARVWSGGVDARLLDAGGVEVAASITRIDVDGIAIRVLAPLALLQPGATYTIERGSGSTSFVVGATRDDEAPAAPREMTRRTVVFDAHESQTCGGRGEYYVELQLEHEGLFALVDRDATTTLDGRAPSGAVSTAAFDGVAALLGSGACVRSWPEAAPGSSAGVRFATFDVAGNFSGWSDSSEVEIPGGCECTATEPTTSTPGLLVALTLLAALALRRRR